MHVHTRKNISSLTLLVIGIVLLGITFFISPPHAISATATPITGYAWSDNVGWISFNCSNTNSCATSNYGLSIAGDGTVSGYAWSDNIGWVSANASDVSGCPSAPCTPVVSTVDGSMVGWFKALATGGGWDGWISLSGASYGVNYGPVLGVSGSFSGYAWGSNVLGWLSFSCEDAGTCGTVDYRVETTYQPCTPNSNVCLDGVTLRHYNADCSYSDATCQFSGYGYGCAVNACLAPASPGAGAIPEGIAATPRLVRAGNTVQVSWDVVNADPASCTVTSSDGASSWSGSSSGTETSAPINAQTTFFLHCNGADVDILTYDAQVTVSIVPTFKEI